MWKKENTTSTQETQKETLEFENSYSRPEPVSSTPSARTDTASIGHTISIDGKISGDEDLIIQGKIKGEIKLSKHTLSVGRNGTVNASILSKIVKVDGEVRGDIEGSERVIINESGKVYGNIKSPRVVLKDGSRFKGNIDMQQNESEQPQKNQVQSYQKLKPSEGSNPKPSSNLSNQYSNNSKNSDSANNTSSSQPNKPNKMNSDSNKDGQEKKKIDLRNL